MRTITFPTNLLSYLFIAIIITGCKKEQEYKADVFPGFSGSGESASWTVYRHTITNSAYLTATLPTLTPPTTLASYEASLVAARNREVSPFSFRFYKDGGVALIQKNAQNIDEWVKQANLKWEVSGDYMYIFRNVGGTWVNIIEVTTELEKILCKYRRSFYGDNSSNKDSFVMEVLYKLYYFN